MSKSIVIPLVLICALGFLAGCSGDGGETFTGVAVRTQTSGLRLTSLQFLAADNPGQLVCDVECTIVGDSVAECWVPHLMAGKRLVPRFTVEGTDSTVQQARLTAGGTRSTASHGPTTTCGETTRTRCSA